MTKRAVLFFIRHLKPDTQIGIVAFSSTAELIQPPTSDQANLTNAIDSLTSGRGTAIGSGIEASLTVIKTDSPTISPSIPVTGTIYKPDAIVLLTDGANNSGVLPLIAAQEAASKGVPIFTIAYETILEANPYPNPPHAPALNQSIGHVDTETLQKIAAITGGEYYSATSAGELEIVVSKLRGSLFTGYQLEEISVLFTACGALSAVAAMVLSALWSPLP
jgi:Ca-activated chloride channel family protein